MKRILYLLAALFTLDVLAFGQGTPPLRISTVDGTVKSNNVGKIVVTNGTLSITGNVATLTISGGGGGSPGGSPTQVQYNDTGSFGGAAGFTFNGTSTITLGVAGTSVGAVAFKNATSGTVTLSPVTGALGTVTLSLPAATDTLVGKATTDTLTNKTLTTPTIGDFTNATHTHANNAGGGTLAASVIASGTLATARGGFNLDVSGIAKGGIVTGSGAGTFAITTVGTDGQVLSADAASTGGVKWIAAGGGITVGTTTIASGTTTKVLFDNAGVVGEYTITGTGNVAMSASPTFTGTVNAANTVLTTAVTTGTGATAGLNVTANSLTTGNGVDISSSSATTGNIVKIASTSTAAASNTLTGLNIAMSGANGTTAQTVTGATISVTNTNATSGTNVALTLTASGATTANNALNVTAGASLFAGTIVQTSASATAFESGPNGSTNPVFRLVNNVASAATGISITGNAAGSGVFLTALSSGSNETIKIVPKGSGSLTSTASGIGFDVDSGGAANYTAITHRGNFLVGGNVSGTAVATTLYIAGNAGYDLVLRRNAAADLAFGAADGASPVAQTTRVQGGTGTNVNGATWTHIGSLGTSQGVPGRLAFQTGALITASGTTAQTAVSRMELGATKVLANNTVTTLVNVTDASNTVASGFVEYTVEVFDGTDLQYESGSFTYGVTNKGGSIANNTITQAGASGVGVTANYPVNKTTSGTLAVTWAISAANPALLSVNANSSLTPSTGYPRVTYTIRNLTQQAIAVQ